MPMRYADEVDVFDQLRLTGADVDAMDRVTRLENGLCDVFDHRIGTSFGEMAVAEERVIVAGSLRDYDYYSWGYPFVTASFNQSTSLVLDIPIRSVIAIETGGTWNGEAWDDGTALTTGQYRLTNGTSNGYYAIESLIGGWAGTVRITGTWGDQPVLTVPDDVREALTFLTIRQYRKVNASPQDQVGPDGLLVPTPHGWDDPLVRGAIARHRVVEVTV